MRNNPALINPGIDPDKTIKNLKNVIDTIDNVEKNKATLTGEEKEKFKSQAEDMMKAFEKMRPMIEAMSYKNRKDYIKKHKVSMVHIYEMMSTYKKFTQSVCPEELENIQKGYDENYLKLKDIIKNNQDEIYLLRMSKIGMALKNTLNDYRDAIYEVQETTDYKPSDVTEFYNGFMKNILEGAVYYTDKELKNSAEQQEQCMEEWNKKIKELSSNEEAKEEEGENANGQA